MNNRKKILKGVTLVEVLTVVAIITIVSFAIASFQKDIFLLNNVAKGGLSVEKEAARVVKIMASEIRGASTGADGSYPIVSANLKELIFFSNVDNDPSVEKVRYYVSGGNLMKGVTNPSNTPPYYSGQPETSSTLVDYLLDPSANIFYYYDSNYDGTTAALSTPIDVNLVRLIKIVIEIDENAIQAPKKITAETQVSIRNLKTNL